MTTLLRPPSEAISPEFSDERLRAIGEVIAKARRDKLSKREPADASWNLSCDCHMWAWFALEEASKGSLGDWLHVPGKHGSLDRVFYVGGPDGVPTKFYNADSPGQPQRTSRPSIAEKMADPDQEDLFEERAEQPVHTEASEPSPSTVIRFAIHMRPDLSAASAALQRLDEDGDVIYEWPIPLQPAGIVPIAQATPRAEGVQLPEPTVELMEDKKAREEEERKRDDNRDNSKGA